MLLKLDIRLTRTPPGSESPRALWLGYILIYLESHTWASKNRRWGRLARCDATKHPTVARRSKQIYLWSTITSTNTTTYGRMPPHNVVQQLRSEFSVTKSARQQVPPLLVWLWDYVFQRKSLNEVSNAVYSFFYRFNPWWLPTSPWYHLHFLLGA